MRETAPPWDPRRVRLARAGRALLVTVLVLGAAWGLLRWLTPDWASGNDVLGLEDAEKARVDFRAAPEVERRVAEVDRMAALVDADRALRRRVISSGEREVFDDGKEIRKVRKNVRSEPGQPAAYVYYYERGYVSLIRVLWSTSAPPGVDEERFYFDPYSLPPLIRWVERDGSVAGSWSPNLKGSHSYTIRYETPRMLDDAVESRVCDRAPTSNDCMRLGFKPQ